MFPLKNSESTLIQRVTKITKNYLNNWDSNSFRLFSGRKRWPTRYFGSKKKALKKSPYIRINIYIYVYVSPFFLRYSTDNEIITLYRFVSEPYSFRFECFTGGSFEGLHFRVESLTTRGPVKISYKSRFRVGSGSRPTRCTDLKW